MPISNEKQYFQEKSGTKLWALVRDKTGFRRTVTKKRRSSFDYNHRLLYLLAAAAFRRVEHLAKAESYSELLRVMEAYADGTATRKEFDEAYENRYASMENMRGIQDVAFDAVHLVPDDYKILEGLDFATDAIGYVAAKEAGDFQSGDSFNSVWKKQSFLDAKHQEELIVCQIIRDIFGNPFQPQPELETTWLSCNDGKIPKLAQSIYDERRFDEMPILADALEEAGCSNAEVLAHCRETEMHVRGCWVLDWLLGKY